MMMNISEEEISAVLARPYVRNLLPDADGGYTVTVQEFPGCIAEGDTAEDALRNFDAAAASWIEAAVASGLAIAEPIEPPVYSGRVALRIPAGLHQDVADLATIDECSINQLLSVAIAEYVGRRQGRPVQQAKRSRAPAAR
jgi:predicted RNase H-like HicB family nuclease